MWMSRISISTNLQFGHLYPTHLPVWLGVLAVTKRDVLKIDALDQWCLRKLLGINHHVRNDEVRWTTKQLHLSAIVQAYLSLFSHIMWLNRDR